MREVIAETVGNGVELVDSGEATADEVKELLEARNLGNSEQISYNQRRQLCDDMDHFFVTDAADRFGKVAERFLGAKPKRLEDIELI